MVVKCINYVPPTPLFYSTNHENDLTTRQTKNISFQSQIAENRDLFGFAMLQCYSVPTRVATNQHFVLIVHQEQ